MPAPATVAGVSPPVESLTFATVAAACAREGLDALAVIAPPGRLDPAGLDALIADGLGDLGWLADRREQRLDPLALLPSARAILAVAWAYQAEAGDEVLRRGRYAAGKDYHVLLREKLARIGKALATGHDQTWASRALVDSAPFNERTVARLAGLGWIGRNALLISPTTGSYRFLGFLLTEAPLAVQHGGHGADRCGSCTACERRCPTAALVGRRVLTTRCISYLTIEHQGVIARELATHFAGWWFGCDICQEVCPWNRFAPPAADARLAGHELDADLLAVTAADYDQHFAGRAIRRLGWERFRRNLLVALWSVGRVDDCRPIIAEGLPLVVAQAEELGLTA